LFAAFLTLHWSQNNVAPKGSEEGERIFLKANSRTYWLRYADLTGKMVRLKTHTDDFDEARKLPDAIQTEKRLEKMKLVAPIVAETNPKQEVPAKPVLLCEIIKDALKYSAANKKTLKADVIFAKNINELFPGFEAEAVTGFEFESRIDELGAEREWKAATRRRQKTFMQLTYRLAFDAGKIKTILHWTKRKWQENNARKRYLKPEELARLTEVIAEHYKTHLAEWTFAINVGLRLGTQYRLTYAMLDEQRKMLDIPGSIMKNGEDFHCPLNEKALLAIRSLPTYAERNGLIFTNQQHPGEPVRMNDYWFTKAKKLAKVTDFHWHDCRHQYASHLVQRGVSLQVVASLLSHKSTVMAQRYAHLAPQQLHDAVAILDGIA
jgi:integrase